MSDARQLRYGDIAACFGTSWESHCIQWGTATPFAPAGLRLGPSHVAMIASDPRLGIAWFESTSKARVPCLVKGREVRGAQVHDPAERIRDCVEPGGQVDIYRLTPLWALTPGESGLLTAKLRLAVESGARYDFRGALISGTRWLKWSRLVTADTEALFCSEMLAVVLQVLGRMPAENPGRFSPGLLLRRLVAAGVYRRAMTFHQHSTEFYLNDGTALRVHNPGERQCA